MIYEKVAAQIQQEIERVQSWRARVVTRHTKLSRALDQVDELACQGVEPSIVEAREKRLLELGYRAERLMGDLRWRVATLTKARNALEEVAEIQDSERRKIAEPA